MKKNIIIVRHAKSEWNGTTPDHERGLNTRGKRDIPLMSSVLIQNYPEIDIALASDSTRTTDTILGIKKYGYTLPEIQFKRNLYLAPIQEFETELAQLADSVNNVLFCGHNPGVSEFTEKMCCLEFLDMPTLGVAWIEIDVDSWQDIYTAQGTIVRYDYPKKK